MTNITTRLLLAAGLASLTLAACQRQEEAPVANEAAESQALKAPDRNDDAGWKAYLQTVVQENMGNISSNPFLYYLPPESDPEFEAKYERQVESASTALGRGIQKDNMVAFGSPASSRMADLIEVAFKEVPADTMKGVRVLFIGDAADNERVQAVVTPTGADYVFVEAK